MRAVEHGTRNKKQKERRAKPARRSFAFYSPRPQRLKGSTKESTSSKPKPSDGDLVAAIGGSVADAFFGASPVVASALGNRPGRDPEAAVRTYHGVPSRPFETGTFYLAGNRNFLFGSDTLG